MRRLLICGFAPFGGEQLNPSWEAVSRLPDQIDDFRLCKLKIPVEFGAAADTVLSTAAKISPDVILCVGQAGGRSAVTPERVGINLQDARIPDNAGELPQDIPIIPGAPAAYFATVPVKAMAAAIQAAGIPSEVSNTAGTYVCNDVLYRLLHRYAGTSVRVGFLHVPYLPEQGVPNLPLIKTCSALEAAILAL
ncbi:MAG TPA: pyroglutamyl-peptidase I [Candidatus Faecousia intestinigallinarum]|nr:pyroglutamyl-peptidase I [Candidatus Faecousia intestinigallinarum]